MLQLWEQGLVDLDAPANDYLRAYQLVPAKAGFRPATVRQLLTHTAGIAELVHPAALLRRDLRRERAGWDGRCPRWPSTTAAACASTPSRAPGSRYTDHGFATLGQIVEDVSGQPLDRYLREHVFEPLGMAHTDLLRSERVRRAWPPDTPCASGGPRAGDRPRGGDGRRRRRLLHPKRHGPLPRGAPRRRRQRARLGAQARDPGHHVRSPTTSPIPALPGIGLAFLRGDAGGHPVVEHQGILPGFKSQIFLAPDDGVGVMAFTNGTRRARRGCRSRAAGLLDHLLGVPDDGHPHRRSAAP